MIDCWVYLPHLGSVVCCWCPSFGCLVVVVVVAVVAAAGEAAADDACSAKCRP